MNSFISFKLAGKIDTDGSKVEEMYDGGKLQEIRDYCETDVLNSYLLYLIFQHHTGSISDEVFEKSKNQIYDFLNNNLNKLHFKKLIFYCSHVLKLSIPRLYSEKCLPFELASAKEFDPIYLNNRVDYYIKLALPFCLNNEAKLYADLSVWNGRSAQCLDLKQYLRYFSSRFGFYYRLGDVTTVPIVPTFLKSRPISSENSNSVILKLNAGRFYDFPKDRLSFNEKKPIAVFVGLVTRSIVKFLLIKLIDFLIQILAILVILKSYNLIIRDSCPSLIS